MSDSKKPPQSIFARSTELFSMAAKIGGREISRRVTQKFESDPKLSQIKAQIDQAKLMVEALGRLKGAAMKVGQMLSLEARDLFPKEVIDILSQLQNKAPPIDYEEIEKILREELGPEAFSSLKEISRKAIAAASIGQVHSAWYEGQKIALKIQYPGISKSVESDIALLKKIVHSFMQIGQRKDINTDALFDELRSVLLQEVNYLKEAEQTQLFYEALKNHPSFVSPHPIFKLSTSHILALSFEEGITLSEWLTQNPSQEIRNQFGKLFLDLFRWEFFEFGRVQTDPNFANFLVKPNDLKIVLLDFGATREYSQQFVADYKVLLRAIKSHDSNKMLDLTYTMNLLSEKESDTCKNAYIELLNKSIEPFNEQLQPFDFSSIDYSAEVRKLTLAFTKEVRHSAPPHQLIFLHRKLGGIFALLRQIEARVDLGPFWTDVFKESTRPL